MTTNLWVADQYDAIRELAKTVGIQVIVDAGSNGNVAVFADDTYADTYLNGGPNDNAGVRVDVTFNERGEVKEAHKRVDGVSKGDVSGHVGNAGQRLLWTLHLFSRR